MNEKQPNDVVQVTLKPLSVDEYYQEISRMPGDMLASVASIYAHDTNPPDPVRLVLSAALRYIAEMKTPCVEGDATCLEHKRQNCACLDEAK